MELTGFVGLTTIPEVGHEVAGKEDIYIGVTDTLGELGMVCLTVTAFIGIGFCAIAATLETFATVAT